jgi:hypothetical protein
MKNLITIILSFIFCLNLNGQFRISSSKELRDRVLKEYDLTYSLPKGYSDADTSMIRKSFRVFELNYIGEYLIRSSDGNIMIHPGFIGYDKDYEEKLRKLFPKSKINLKDEYRNVIIHLISKNTNQPREKISLENEDINFYCKHNLKQLGADMAGDYTMKLNIPYKEEYNYVTYRFVGKYYKAWIHTFIFYKEYNPRIAKKTLKETLYMFKFNN